jgi:hypothetical protein
MMSIEMDLIVIVEEKRTLKKKDFTRTKHLSTIYVYKRRQCKDEERKKESTNFFR